MGAEMALQLASESLGEREGRDFQRRRENPPSPATERRLLLTAKCFHTVFRGFARWGTTVKIADHEMREVNQAPRSRRQDACGNWPQLQRKRLDDCEVECLMESGVEERLF
jgi:hypothetical protein